MPDRDEIDALLRMAEAYANSEPIEGTSGRFRRIAQASAEQMTSHDYVEITMPWRLVMRLIDEPLAYAITGIWVPRWLLESRNTMEEMIEILSSSRAWFDETKLDQSELSTIHMAVHIAMALVQRRDRDGTAN